MNLRFCGLFLLACMFSIAAHAQDAKRSITKVAGDVYRFQNNFHYSLIVVSDAGVVVVDPISESAATWLRDNLKTITDKPITHLAGRGTCKRPDRGCCTTGKCCVHH